ncbi:hypothetical protein K439DRAFT_437086 [Ramaria rubella]|nr:hypothetical protein K439DRAFT_437086 [Ramaria rubella]
MLYALIRFGWRDLRAAAFTPAYHYHSRTCGQRSVAMSEYDPPPPYPGRDNSYNPHSTQSDSDAPGPPDTIAPSASGLNYPPPTTFRYIPLPTVTVLQPHQSLNAFSDGQPNSSNISSPHHHDIQAAPARITLHRVLQSRTTTDESIPLLWDMRYPPHAAVSAHLLDETAASPPMRKMRIRITDWVIKVKAPRGAFLTKNGGVMTVERELVGVLSFVGFTFLAGKPVSQNCCRLAGRSGSCSRLRDEQVTSLNFSALFRLFIFLYHLRHGLGTCTTNHLFSHELSRLV